MSRRFPARTRTQLLVVDGCLLLAVLLLWNRPQLPGWVRLEGWGIDHALRPGQALDPTGQFEPVIRLRGRSTLLVGDSLLMHHPWDADLLAYPANDLQAMREGFAEHIAGRRYERIILWGGTTDLVRADGDVRPYVREMCRAARMARRYADRVLVVGPMPYVARDWVARTGRPVHTGNLYPATVSEAVTALRASLPDEVAVLDVAAFRARVRRDGHERAYFVDGFHLSQPGFLALREYLADVGWVVPMPRSSDEALLSDPAAAPA